MTIYKLDPLTNQRWHEFTNRHEDASAFHSVCWMQVLNRTHGYQPIVYTTSAPSEDICNGALFCRVDSCLTGKRLVSVPFADHCQPLVADPSAWREICDQVVADCIAEGMKQVELRPLYYCNAFEQFPGFRESKRFFFHQIDLCDDWDIIQSRFHKTSVQQMVRRADRDGLSYEEGRGSQCLDAFYKLLLITRRRQGMPPQPKRWFRNMLDFFGNDAKIRLAFLDGVPTAAIFTIMHKSVCYFKYSCSNPNHSVHGGTQKLLSEAIREAKECGCRIFDMGRSDPENPGLVQFKDRWGADRHALTYYRYPPSAAADAQLGWKRKLAKVVLCRTPYALLAALGALVYEHIG